MPTEEKEFESLSSVPLSPEEILRIDPVDELAMIACVNSLLRTESYTNALKQYGAVITHCGQIKPVNLRTYKKHFSKFGWNVDIHYAMCNSDCGASIGKHNPHVKFTILQEQEPKGIWQRILEFIKWKD